MTVEYWYALAAGAAVLGALSVLGLRRHRKSAVPPHSLGRVVFPQPGGVGRYAFDNAQHGPFPDSLAASEEGPAVVAIVHFVQPAETGTKKRYDSVSYREAEELVRRIRRIPSGRPIHLILHTPGGYTFPGQAIAQALQAHRGPITAFVPYHAMSAGTMIALTAETIHLGPGAALGPIDTQYGHIPVDAYLQLLKKKGAKRIDDEMLLVCFTAQKIASDDEGMLCGLINRKHGRGDPCAIARYLASGTHFHGYRVTYDKARELGINVRPDVPDEIFAFVDGELAANEADLRKEEEQKRGETLLAAGQPADR